MQFIGVILFVVLIAFTFVQVKQLILTLKERKNNKSKKADEQFLDNFIEQEKTQNKK